MDLGLLINKAISKAETVLSRTEGTIDLNDTLWELENFIRLVNVITKQAGLSPGNQELFQTRHHEIYALYDKITLCLTEQRKLLSKELKIHHKNHDAIKSYTGEK